MSGDHVYEERRVSIFLLQYIPTSIVNYKTKDLILDNLEVTFNTDSDIHSMNVWKQHQVNHSDPY